MSYVRRDGAGHVLREHEALRRGDEVLVIGSEATLAPAVEAIGTRLPYSLTENRTDVDHRVFTISNPEIAGRTLAEIDLDGRLGGRVTRVLRGDTQILARPDVVLALGDRVLAVLPAGTLDEAAVVFRDSHRRVSEVDALSLGVGMGLGLALGAMAIPLGRGFFALGAAAGPLVVGMILGRLRRTGRLVWELPHSANLTIRQLGLLLFLTCVDLSSGQAFAATAFTARGVAAGFVAIGLAVVITVLAWAGCAAAGLSTARTAGLVAGIIGQPALLAFAQSRTDDERVETGYSTVFAIGLVVKAVIAYLLTTAW